MKTRKSVRLRWLAAPLFAGALFAGCSNSDDSSVAEYKDPPSLDIEPPASTLGCDDSLVVALTIANFDLKPPYNCGTNSTCGSVQVSLLETADGAPLASVRAATATVQFDLAALVSPPSADAPSLSQVHFIKAELLGDSLQPVAATAGGHPSQMIPVSLSAPSCAGEAGTGGAAGAATGSAGQAGSAAGQAGAASGGDSSSGGVAGAAGAAGSDSGGAGGSGGPGGGASAGSGGASAGSGGASAGSGGSSI